jgi:hypothetical protein
MVHHSSATLYSIGSLSVTSVTSVSQSVPHSGAGSLSRGSLTDSVRVRYNDGVTCNPHHTTPHLELDSCAHSTAMNLGE